MDNKDTIVIVGVTREDEFGNLWVTPQGGGDEIKIAAKRSKLHPLFEQGRAIMLHWETYMNRPYVADAKPVEGELPEPKSAYTPPPEEKPKPTAYAKLNPELPKTISGQEIGRCWNAIDTLFIGGKLPTLFGKENAEAILKYYRGILTSTLKLPVDGKKLPQWDKTAKGE